MTGPRVPDKALRVGVLAGIALLLLTPFVVTPGTVFPYVVGKALWSRSIIEIVFALWAVLALAKPEYRPPRSWLLLLLVAGLGVSLLAAGFGVSVQRSLWSTYERMQGVVDLAHWLAFAVVLVSMLRTGAEWRALLTLNLAVSSAMACLVIARYVQIDVPFFSALPEPHLPRLSGPFGNPTHLSAYLLPNLVVALGFAVRSWLPAAAALAAPEPRPKSWRRRRNAAATQSDRPGSPWLGGLLWAVVAALHLWGLGLAGSVGGFAGLFAGVGFLALGYAVLARGYGRGIAVAAVVVLGVAAILLVIRFVDPDRIQSKALDNRIARYVVNVHVQRPSVQSRLAAWETGVAGFVERPVLGWGPENFETVFGRFASGYAATARPHDHAHGKLVEVAATTGVPGLAAYLALWSSTFLIVRRAARRTDRREQALTLFAGAALAGGWVQSQFLFDTAAGSLQTIVLLGVVIGLEPAAVPESRQPRLPARLAGALAALLRRRGARLVLALAATALTAAGLTTHHAIYAAADVRYVTATPAPAPILADGIDGFPPLANTYRSKLFNDLRARWPQLRAEDGPRAARLLDWVEREAEEVVRTEPENWRIHQSLAHLYRAVAATDPGYGAKARHFLERTRALAPNRPVFPRPLLPPEPLGVRRLDDGRHELHWRRAEGAGYHQVGEARGDGLWHVILYSYDPDQTSFITPGRKEPGTYRYRIQACRFPGHCSADADWPPLTVTAGANRGRPR